MSIFICGGCCTSSPTPPIVEIFPYELEDSLDLYIQENNLDYYEQE